MLEEAGSGIPNVVKVNVFLTDMANFAVRASGSRGAEVASKLLNTFSSLEHERRVRQVVRPQAGPQLRRCEAAAKGSGR